MLAAIKRFFTGSAKPLAINPADMARAHRILRARYDAAQTTDNNRRHWAFADALSASAANSHAVRVTLRNRSRYEVANNSYARGIVLTLGNDCIGTGPRLQMLGDDRAANNFVEREFGAWLKAIRAGEKLRTMRMAKVQDGESFGLLHTNPLLKTPVQLDLGLIETDQISAPWQNYMTDDGILHDRFGNALTYYMRRTHPGDTTANILRVTDPAAFDEVPASSMIHYFRVDRPGQTRGIPEFTPALPLFAMLRDYTLATLDAAKAAAYFAAILKSAAPADGESVVSGTPFEGIELERNMVTTMPEGWDLTQLKAEQPTNTYKEFKLEIVNEIARCLNIPFNIAAGNSSSYNYASGRMDHQVYFKALRVEQAQVCDVILDRLFSAWLEEACLIPNYFPESLTGIVKSLPHQWFFDGHEHVDPSKEASAQGTRLQNNTTTLAEEYAKRGRDWEQELRQRAKEIALQKELGIPIVWPLLVPPVAAPPGTGALDPNEDDETDDDPDTTAPDEEY